MSLVAKPVNGQVDRRSSEYLAQLLNDKKQLQALPNVFLHVEKILDDEINRVRGGLLHWNNGVKDMLRLPEPSGPIVTLSEKLFVPVNEYPEFNFVGRILGPRGMTAKQLETDTGCKIMVRGKGSMRDKVKEEQNRGKPNWEHLNEDLHVLVTVEDTENRADIKLQRAVEEVKKLLVPTAEGEDELKKMQLMELAIMNGTYRDALPGTTIAFINTPQGPRMIATQPGVGMSAMLQQPPVMQPPGIVQQQSLPAGTPIFFTQPRLPQFTSVTSLPTQAMLAASHMSQFMSATSSASPGGQIVYSYDPYGQRMLEYSANLEASAAGAVPRIRKTVTVREHPYTRGPLA
jgi:protein quaking